MAGSQLPLDQLPQNGCGHLGAAMRQFSMPLSTTASAGIVTLWFAAAVTRLGGTVKLVAWPSEVQIALPQEVAYEDLLAFGSMT
jgi:hypothetical protein